MVEGYLDWQILLIITNIVCNYRVNPHLNFNVSDPKKLEKMLTDCMMSTEKKDSKPIPMSLFSKKNIDIQKRIIISAIAKTWDLHMKSFTPNSKAIKTLLDVRYHNLKDDVEHEDIFKI